MDNYKEGLNNAARYVKAASSPFDEDASAVVYPVDSQEDLLDEASFVC